MIERDRFAVWILATGLSIGFAGSLFFFEQPLGLSFPAFTLLALASLGLLARAGGIALPVRNLWPLIPLLFFAIMVAVRTSASLTISNLLAVLSLGGLVIYYLPGQRFIDTDSTAQQVVGILQTSIAVIFTPVATLVQGARFFQQERDPEAPGAHRSRAITRGLLLALPVVLIFGILLGAADAVFESYLTRLWNLFQIENVEELVGRLFLAGIFAWLAWGALAYGLARNTLSATSSDSSPRQPGDDPFSGANTSQIPPPPPALRIRLSMIETGIVLGSVTLLFAAFVGIQFAYFFGGRANITLEGLTYADYARRGFFELVMVSVLVLGLGLLLDNLTSRDTRGQEALFRGLMVAVLALTSVMLVSAWQRMALYETAYGYTHLRIYTHVFMIWLGMLFGVYLLSLFRPDTPIFSTGLILVVTAYLVTLNLINPDLMITERNLARFQEGYELDVRYLESMSADATPALVRFYASLDEADDPIRTCAGMLLDREATVMQRARQDRLPVLGNHIAREQAWQLLEPLADALPAYAGAYLNDNCYWGITSARAE